MNKVNEETGEVIELKPAEEVVNELQEEIKKTDELNKDEVALNVCEYGDLWMKISDKEVILKGAKKQLVERASAFGVSKDDLELYSRLKRKDDFQLQIFLSSLGKEPESEEVENFATAIEDIGDDINSIIEDLEG